MHCIHRHKASLGDTGRDVASFAKLFAGTLWELFPATHSAGRAGEERGFSLAGLGRRRGRTGLGLACAGRSMEKKMAERRGFHRGLHGPGAGEERSEGRGSDRIAIRTP